MNFENYLIKIILRHCDENKVEKMTAEEAWLLAKKIATVAKPKSRKEIKQ